MTDVDSFDFSEIFDDATVRLQTKYVDVKVILARRELNRLEKERRIAELKEAEEKQSKEPSKLDVPSNDTDEPPSKKKKNSSKNEKRGQNKNREKTEKRIQDSDKVCQLFDQGKCDRDDCKFSHDFEAVWAKREEDLGKILNCGCPIFEKFGYCKYGFNCRFV